jgi:hypothetical protein
VGNQDRSFWTQLRARVFNSHVPVSADILISFETSQNICYDFNGFNHGGINYPI